MPLTLSEAQYKTIMEKLLLFKSPSPALSKPVNTDDGSQPTHFATRIKPVANTPRFSALSFSVVDFTADRMKPRIFLHKEDVPWRMASAGKIAPLLAAAQLRDDVRNVKGTGLVTSPADFDELFATIWSRSKDPLIKGIAGVTRCPRVSTVINVGKTPPDFVGADVALNRSGLALTHLNSWAQVTDHTFRDRLWLMAAESDNLAATSCVSEVGVGYMKAVQRAYGLFHDDKKRGMRMLLSSGYSGVDQKAPVSKAAGAPKYRKVVDSEFHWVTDAHGKGSDAHLSTQPATVAALTAYMIALIQDKLPNKDGCDAIKAHLADEQPDTQHGSLVRGVAQIAPVTKAHAKVGVLGALRCEFAYMESAGFKYAIVAQGLLPFRVGGSVVKAEVQGNELAKAVHSALVAP
jgi:hypothetical protein